MGLLGRRAVAGLAAIAFGAATVVGCQAQPLDEAATARAAAAELQVEVPTTATINSARVWTALSGDYCTDLSFLLPEGEVEAYAARYFPQGVAIEPDGRRKEIGVGFSRCFGEFDGCLLAPAGEPISFAADHIRRNEASIPRLLRVAPGCRPGKTLVMWMAASR